MNRIKDLIKYFELLKTSIKKEFRGKYKKSFLGVLWSFLNPLFQLIIYAIVFSFVLRQEIDNYVCFLVIALIPWNFFVFSVNQAAVSIWSNFNLIKKVYFPREILPLSVVTSNCISFLISLVLVFAFIVFTDVGFSISILLLPIAIVIEYLFIAGTSLIVSALTVYFRDLEHIISVGLNMLFYLTPIVYSIDFIPNNYLTFFKLNPMFHIINVYRDILYYHQIPNLASLSVLLIMSIVFFIGCYWLFTKLEKRFAEEL